MGRTTEETVIGNGSDDAEVGAVVDTGDNPVRDIAVPLRPLPPVSVDMVRVDEPSTPDCISVGPAWYTVGDLVEMTARFTRAIEMASSHRSLRGFQD